MTSKEADGPFLALKCPLKGHVTGKKIITTTYYHNKTTWTTWRCLNNCSDSRTLFKTFSSLLFSVLLPLLHQILQLITIFFTNKTRAEELMITSLWQIYTLSPRSLLSLRRKFLNLSFPIIPLLVHLILFYLAQVWLKKKWPEGGEWTSFRTFIIQSYLRLLTLSTSLFTLVHFPQHLSRLG